MARVTLSTIAQETGLSKFAVSRSLSGKDGVSDETRRRVQEVADQLGYVRSPSDMEAPTLGVVFHDTDLINSELRCNHHPYGKIRRKAPSYPVIEEPDEARADLAAMYFDCSKVRGYLGGR